jgi:hypothetical protein
VTQKLFPDISREDGNRYLESVSVDLGSNAIVQQMTTTFFSKKSEHAEQGSEEVEAAVCMKYRITWLRSCNCKRLCFQPSCFSFIYVFDWAREGET